MAELKADLEEGNNTDFDSETDADGDLNVNGTSALVGSYGAELTLDDVNDAYFTWNSTSVDALSGDLYRARFYIDPNGVSYPDGGDFYLLWMQADSSYASITTIFRVRFGWDSSSGYYVYIQTKDDADATLSLTTTYLPSPNDDVHYVEVYEKREVSDGSADGEFRGYIDGVEMGGTITNLENYNVFPTHDTIDFGAVSAVDATPSGSMYLDDLIVRDTGGLIGPTGEALSIGVTPDDMTYYTQGIRVK